MRPATLKPAWQRSDRGWFDSATGLTRDAVDAEGLAQRALLRAFTNRHRFKPGTNLRAWLFTIARNCHIDRVRKAQRRGHMVELDEETDVAVQSANQFAHVELLELQDALAELSDTDREVLTMVAVDGKTYEEVAEATDVAVGTVKSRLSRARERLRAKMQHSSLSRKSNG